MSEVQEFVLKVIGGSIAILLFALSSFGAEPVLVIDPTLRAALLVAGLFAFGLSVKQGYQSTQVSQYYSTKAQVEGEA